MDKRAEQDLRRIAKEYGMNVPDKLTEQFTREFKDNVDWDCISAYQKLTEQFTREFKDKVNWDCISAYQKLTEQFIKEFNLTMPWRFDRLSKTERYKLIKQYCKDNDLYCNSKEKYLVAYKSVRDNWYSVFNFQIKYKLNKETRVDMCDCTNEENSFGLSAWTKEEALKYYNKGILLKVKVKFDDVGYLRKDGKIRCWDLTPIEKC